MTRRDIETLVRAFYEQKARKQRKVIGYGEIVPDKVFWELSRGPAIVGDGETFGVTVVEIDDNGEMRELASKCKACGSLFLARKHIKGLKMAAGTWQSKATKARVRAAKLTEAPANVGRA